VLAQFSPADHRGPLVKQAGKRPQQPCFALPALTEQDKIVARDQRTLDLGQHGVVEAQDARPDLVTLGQRGQQVFPDFLFDSPFTVPGGTQFADGAGQVIRSGHHSTLRRRSGYGTAPGLLEQERPGNRVDLPGLPRVDARTD